VFRGIVVFWKLLTFLHSTCGHSTCGSRFRL